MAAPDTPGAAWPALPSPSPTVAVDQVARESLLAATGLALTQAMTEAEITDEVRTATREIAPDASLRFRCIRPDGWHALIEDDGIHEAFLEIPLRAGGALLGEIVILSANPLPAGSVVALAELSSHVGLAMARLALGRLIDGQSAATDGSVTTDPLRDDLTGLPTRMVYQDRLEVALNRRARNIHPVAVLRIHLAGSITAVYEGMGSTVGDELLTHVARRLQRLVRPSDTVARFGTDDFAAILDDLDSVADAALVAERLMDGLSEPFMLADRIPISIQGSIGVAVNTGAADTALDLLHKADNAMYSARAAGHGCIEVYDPRFHMDEPDRRSLR